MSRMDDGVGYCESCDRYFARSLGHDCANGDTVPPDPARDPVPLLREAIEHPEEDGICHFCGIALTAPIEGARPEKHYPNCFVLRVRAAYPETAREK